MAAATIKHAAIADEVKALGGLMQDMMQREVETRRQVGVIDTRLAAVERDMKNLDDTVTGMIPMLKTNTEVTSRTAADVIEIKNVVDKIGPGIDTLTQMVTAQKERETVRRWWGVVQRRGISTSHFVVAMGAMCTAIATGFWFLWTHVKVVGT